MSSDNNTTINLSALADSTTATAPATAPAKPKTPCSTAGCKKFANLTFTKAGRPLCLECINQWNAANATPTGTPAPTPESGAAAAAAAPAPTPRGTGKGKTPKMSRREIESLTNPQLKDRIAALREELAALEAERERRIAELG